MLDTIKHIAEVINSYAPLLIAFFLWRIARHLKIIRKHVAGKILFDTFQSCVQNYTFRKKEKTDKEVDKDETKDNRG